MEEEDEEEEEKNQGGKKGGQSTRVNTRYCSTVLIRPTLRPLALSIPPKHFL